jgi:hypothetical protein
VLQLGESAVEAMKGIGPHLCRRAAAMKVLSTAPLSIATTICARSINSHPGATGTNSP